MTTAQRDSRLAQDEPIATRTPKNLARPGIRGPSFWAAVRGRSRALALTAVFFLFASVGLMSLQMNPRPSTPGRIFLAAFISGTFAMGYATLFVTRRVRYFPLLVAMQFLLEWLRAKYYPPSTIVGDPQILAHQISIIAFCATMGIIAAYSLLVHFFHVEGQRYYHVHAEISLASEIHRSLVPVCQQRLDHYVIYGASVPSGEVGGDLVDFIVGPEGRWTGYVADVSGHGVQSGVLMAMFKTAVRGHLLTDCCPAQLLNLIQETLFPLKLPTMFVTSGILQGGASGRIAFASAGHPPILHYRKTANVIYEYPSLDPPLGMFAKQTFSESTIDCEAGDALLILTDGLTEVFDKSGAELGLEPLKSAFIKNANLPLEQLFVELQSVATGFGAQSDDQTMLLARYLG